MAALAAPLQVALAPCRECRAPVEYPPPESGVCFLCESLGPPPDSGGQLALYLERIVPLESNRKLEGVSS